MRQRVANIKKQLQQLASYQSSAACETGNAKIAMKREPSVSFGMSDAVVAYAHAIQPKLLGNDAFDSDAITPKASSLAAADASDPIPSTSTSAGNANADDCDDRNEMNFEQFSESILDDDYQYLSSGDLFSDSSTTLPSFSHARTQ